MNMRLWQCHWNGILVSFVLPGIQFFTMETTLNRRNCQYRTTQSPRSHVCDTGQPLTRSITGRCHFSPACLQLRPESRTGSRTERFAQRAAEQWGKEQCCQRYLVCILGYECPLQRNVGKVFPMCLFPFGFSWEYYFQTKNTSFKLYPERLVLALELRHKCWTAKMTLKIYFGSIKDKISSHHSIKSESWEQCGAISPISIFNCSSNEFSNQQL